MRLPTAGSNTSLLIRTPKASFRYKDGQRPTSVEGSPTPLPKFTLHLAHARLDAAWMRDSWCFLVLVCVRTQCDRIPSAVATCVRACVVT